MLFIVSIHAIIMHEFQVISTTTAKFQNKLGDIKCCLKMNAYYTLGAVFYGVAGTVRYEW